MAITNHWTEPDPFVNWTESRKPTKLAQSHQICQEEQAKSFVSFHFIDNSNLGVEFAKSRGSFTCDSDLNDCHNSYQCRLAKPLFPHVFFHRCRWLGCGNVRKTCGLKRWDLGVIQQWLRVSSPACSAICLPSVEDWNITGLSFILLQTHLPCNQSLHSAFHREHISRHNFSPSQPFSRIVNVLQNGDENDEDCIKSLAASSQPPSSSETFSYAELQHCSGAG